MKIVPLIKGGDGVPRRISDDMIAQICDENDIIDYVSRYVQLKKSGRDYSGLCPFHHEKHRHSMKSGETAFHCFGCGASGNLVQFVMRTENLDFIDALKLLPTMPRYNNSKMTGIFRTRP